MPKFILNALRGLMLSLLLAVSAQAQEDAIQGTITSQFEAFKVDDFDRAFTYATPRLRSFFQSPENFRRMVTQGYPMVWRPADVQYLELEEYSGSMWQKVRIVDEKGFMHLLVYRMEQTEEGWRIAGVQILDAPAATA